MITPLQYSDKNDLTSLNKLNKSAEFSSDVISTTGDSFNDCCIIEEVVSVEKEVKMLLKEILQNKIFDEVDDISDSQDDIRELLWNQFELFGLNGKEAARAINQRMGKNIVTERRAIKLFRYFRLQQNITNNDLLMKRFDENPTISPEDLSKGICSIIYAKRWLLKKSREGSDSSSQNSVNRRDKFKEPLISKALGPYMATRKRKSDMSYMEHGNNLEKNAKEDNANGQHSICQIDPVTKKRFYEPHRRPGCDDIYCLSSVTQIGERICNIENKMIRLEELFFDLTKKNTSNLLGNNYITYNQNQSQQPQPSFFSQQQFLQQYNKEHQNIRYSVPTNNFNGSQAKLAHSNSTRNLLPIQKNNQQIYRQNNPIPTKNQVQQRIIASKPPLAYSRLPVRQILPVASATATISATRPLSSYPMNQPLRITYPQPTDNNSSKPLDIPNKELRNGVRVYFENTTNNSQNTCPVCFGVFSGIIFTDRSGSLIQNIHLKRHISGPLEAFYCHICSHCVTQPRVLFLSLPSIVQHLINSHGMSRSGQFSSFCIKNYNNSETIEALQHFMANQLRLSITQLITEMNSPKDNLNWTKSTTVGQKTSAKINVKSKNTKELNNSTSSTQNKKKKRYGREETPLFDLDGDVLDHLLKCPKECTLIQRHRMLKGRKQPNKLLEQINMKNFVIDQSLLGLAKYVDYKNDYKHTKNAKQPCKESGSVLVIDLDKEDSEPTYEKDDDDDISSNDSDYTPKKSNKGWTTSKSRKKLGSSERATFNNVVEQLQQHRQQQMNKNTSSSHLLPLQNPWMNINLNKSQSSNGLHVCKTEPANQKH